jgi:cytochrome c peroxidase
LPGGSHCLVVDAFGGQVAVVDVAMGKLESVRSTEGHNFRGLALSRDQSRVVLVHQVLHPQGRPNATDIRSGTLLANHLRTFDLDTVRDSRVELLKNERIYNLGDIERGAGDPADVHETADGLYLVCLAGTNELAVGRPEQVLWDRVSVGARPCAVAVDEGRGRAYVANTFDDSISIVDFRTPKLLGSITLRREPIELTRQERGEALFHDARLSLDAWFSCQSCHPDGHTNGRLNDNFSDRSFGTPKRVLSLRGVRDTPPWAWNGLMPELEAQIRSSVTSTMQGSTPSPKQIADLAAYLQSLEPVPGVATARGDIDADAFKRGRKVFSREKCATCHAAPTYTTPKTYDVGLRDEAGESHFNPPSLRGVSQGGPRYFHDNRARSLADVFGTHRHQLAAPLTEGELADLLVYLRSL